MGGGWGGAAKHRWQQGRAINTKHQQNIQTNKQQWEGGGQRAAITCACRQCKEMFEGQQGRAINRDGHLYRQTESKQGEVNWADILPHPCDNAVLATSLWAPHPCDRFYPCGKHHPYNNTNTSEFERTVDGRYGGQAVTHCSLHLIQTQHACVSWPPGNDQIHRMPHAFAGAGAACCAQLQLLLGLGTAKSTAQANHTHLRRTRYTGCLMLLLVLGPPELLNCNCCWKNCGHGVVADELCRAPSDRADCYLAPLGCSAGGCALALSQSLPVLHPAHPAGLVHSRLLLLHVTSPVPDPLSLALPACGLDQHVLAALYHAIYAALLTPPFHCVQMLQSAALHAVSLGLLSLAPLGCAHAPACSALEASGYVLALAALPAAHAFGHPPPPDLGHMGAAPAPAAIPPPQGG
eukprot:scaffold21729_cov17-Tisochrysis_lutea.AAC.1